MERSCDYMMRTILADMACIKLNIDKNFSLNIKFKQSSHEEYENTAIVVYFGKHFSLTTSIDQAKVKIDIPGHVYSLICRESISIQLEKDTILLDKCLIDLMQRKLDKNGLEVECAETIAIEASYNSIDN